MGWPILRSLWQENRPEYLASLSASNALKRVYRAELPRLPGPEACLAQLYSNERFEAACQRALTGGRISYGLLNEMLKNNLDRQERIQENLFRTPQHQNIRGKNAYQ